MTYIVIVMLVLYALYYRYVPVRGVKELTSLSSYEQVTLLDVRDYNEADEMNGALRVPVAYLKRYYQTIPNRQVIVIAKSNLEKNAAIRLLGRYHFSIEGYYIKGHEHVNELNMVKCH